MIELTSPPVTDRKMVDLFSIDNTVYQMPARVGANIALGYMRMVRTLGQEAAMGWVLEKVIGADAYTALMGYDGLTEDELKQVMQAVHVNVMGAVEDPKGNGPKS